MQIEFVEGGFTQYFDNEVIEKIVCLGDCIQEVDKYKFVGTCSIYFHHRPPKELCSMNFNVVYNSQYGMPISEDGSKLFVGHWEKTLDGDKRGLEAYDIESGFLLWRLNEGKIREVFVYSNYLVALQANGAVFKVDIDSGKILAQIKSGTIEQQFDLGSSYILVEAVRGKLSVIDTEKMAVVKVYGPNVVNPSNYLSVLIQNVILQDDILTVSGLEGYSNDDDFNIFQECPISQEKPFSRVIDSSFSSF